MCGNVSLLETVSDQLIPDHAIFINENLHKISSVFSFHIRNFKNESRLVLLKPFYAFIYCAYLKKIAKNPVRIKTLIGLVSSLFDCVSVVLADDSQNQVK